MKCFVFLLMALALAAAVQKRTNQAQDEKNEDKDPASDAPKGVLDKSREFAGENFQTLEKRFRRIGRRRGLKRRITFIKVDAMTSDALHAQSGSPHVLVIVLKNGDKCEAKLENFKYPNAPYEIELSAQSDFQPPLVCTKRKIKKVYLEARGMDGWNIASIDTYAKNIKKGYTKLTADPDFNKWLDGDQEEIYPYDAKKLLLTKSKKKKGNKN